MPRDIVKERQPGHTRLGVRIQEAQLGVISGGQITVLVGDD